MKISIIFLLIFLSFSCQIYGHEEMENYNDLTLQIDSIIQVYGFNGVISLSNETDEIYSRAVGLSSFEDKTPIKDNDLFVIGSISKQITAVLILREYEKSNLALNDTINKYLTNIHQPWVEEVTIHQLLTHTHGIISLDKPLEFKRGSQFHYSQLGYELLALILEKVTGKTFSTLSTELFQEHELNNTFHPSNIMPQQIVKGYVENKDGVLVFATNSLNNYVPAGGFISNTSDLKRWNQMLYSYKLVKQETLELMATNYATRIHPIFESIEYGYGLLFKKGEEKIQIGALGYAPGFVSACYYHPKTKMNLIILENTAKNLDNFKKTFKVHTEIMKLIKTMPNNSYRE